MVLGLILLLVFPAMCLSSMCQAPPGSLHGQACQAGAAFNGTAYGKVHYTVTKLTPGFSKLCCEGWACGVGTAISCTGFNWFRIGCTIGPILHGLPLTWASQHNQPQVRCLSNPVGTTFTVSESHP